MPFSNACSAVSSAFKVGVVVAMLGLSSCFTGDPGLSPPLDSFNFPTALVITGNDSGGQSLYVVNSDFDLHYNGGTVQVLDVAAIRKQVQAVQSTYDPTGAAPPSCSAAGLSNNPSPLLYPGPCAPVAAPTFIKKAAILGAFASNAVLVQRPDGGGARLFITVRGDPSVTYFDVSDDRQDLDNPACSGDFCMNCGQGEDHRCTDAFRIGVSPFESTRGIRLPLEPIGIASTSVRPAPKLCGIANGTATFGNAIAVAHQTQSQASLIVNCWDSQPRKPTLSYSLSNLAPGPTELAALPIPAIVEASQTDSDDTTGIAYLPGFMLTYRAAGQLDLLRYLDDTNSSPPRPFLALDSTTVIRSNAGGGDSRGIAIDASKRAACEQACNSMDLDCLKQCTEIPVRIYVANRSPASLLVIEATTRFAERGNQNIPVSDCTGITLNTGVCVEAAFELLKLIDTVPLSFGASRVAIGHVIDQNGDASLRIFTTAFESRLVFSYDPEARRVDAIIRTGRGPQSLAFDTGFDPTTQKPTHSFLYVGHFTDSYIGLVDLDMRKPSFGTMILTLGQPETPPESQ